MFYFSKSKNHQQIFQQRNGYYQKLKSGTTAILYQNYNQPHNSLRLFDVLPNFPFTTSETMCGYYLQTWCIQVPSRVAERFKAQDLRKLGNIRKRSKLQMMIAQYPFENESFVNTRRKLLKNRNYTFHVVYYFTSKLELVSDIL